jgi:hypothetical protein
MTRLLNEGFDYINSTNGKQWPAILLTSDMIYYIFNENVLKISQLTFDLYTQKTASHKKLQRFSQNQNVHFATPYTPFVQEMLQSTKPK